MNTQRPAKRSLLPSFALGLIVLLLSLAQGGPWPALAAIGRGAGVIKPPMPTPSADVVPYEYIVGQAMVTPSARPANAGRTPVTPTATPTPDSLAYSRITTWSFPDEPRIEAMRTLIVQTLKERELTFKGTIGPVSTFFPGDGYQGLWGRDFTFIVPMAQYLYGDEHLRSGIEELLARQYAAETRSTGGDLGLVIGAGALPCTVWPDGKFEKTTVTSDEETTVIQAAYLYYRAAGGVAWLKKDLSGRSVLDRLNAAIEWLYANRFDPARRLIKRGHTTDWGDVKFEPAIDPTDINPKLDHWTASIYDQAMTYRALRQLAEMNQAVGRDDQAKLFIARADDLRQAANRFLWMPERGYYRIHTHITPLTHRTVAEDDILAIGNAVAIYAGLTTEEQERSIIQKLEAARLAAGVHKPGLSLYPAYPTGFFATVQRHRGEYQNGGVWDWWGGVQITAEFQRGYSDLALAHLHQVAADWAKHPSAIWEWSLPGADIGRGSKGYAAAAGAVGEAIIAGLYGVNITRDGLRLEPRLSTHNGEVHVYQPATDRYAAYRYTYTADVVSLRYSSNVTGEVMLRVLVPAGRVVQSVTIGGVSVMPRREVVGNDTYAVFKGPAGSAAITITLAAAPAGTARLAVDPAFADYYQTHDGARLLGSPLTPAFAEGARRAQYFEKGKLEDHRAATSDPVWQFSYGLLAEELVRSGADLPVGGERSTITYADLKALAAEDKRLAPPKGFGGGVHVYKDGSAFIPFSAELKPVPGHSVPAIFWYVMMNKTRSPGGWLHDVGLPLTEPAWATVDKGNVKGRRVLVQAFQRTILTYDPQNTPSWQVERANIGVDYLKVFPERGR